MNSPTPFTKPCPLPGLRSIVALLLAVSILFTGCTTLRSVPVPAPGQPQTESVKIGDKVEVVTKNAGKLAFTVTAIESEAFVGKAKEVATPIRVNYQDIAGLQIRRLDALHTTGAVVVVVVAMTATLVVIAFHSMSI
jgi:hypothetical protein